jgi:hypothetical protein
MKVLQQAAPRFEVSGASLARLAVDSVYAGASGKYFQVKDDAFKATRSAEAFCDERLAGSCGRILSGCAVWRRKKCVACGDRNNAASAPRAEVLAPWLQPRCEQDAMNLPGRYNE